LRACFISARAFSSVFVRSTAGAGMAGEAGVAGDLTSALGCFCVGWPVVPRSEPVEATFGVLLGLGAMARAAWMSLRSLPGVSLHAGNVKKELALSAWSASCWAWS
jgi:hypothetical protein